MQLMKHSTRKKLQKKLQKIFQKKLQKVTKKKLKNHTVMYGHTFLEKSPLWTMNEYTQSPYIKRKTLGNHLHPPEKHTGGEGQNTSVVVKC